MSGSKKTKKTKTTTQRRQAMLNLKSRCVQCGKPLFKAIQPPPKVSFETNGMGEKIAWCVCARCGKISPVRLSALKHDY